MIEREREREREKEWEKGRETRKDDIDREGVHNVGHDPNCTLRPLFGSFAIRESVQRVSKNIRS